MILFPLISFSLCESFIGNTNFDSVKLYETEKSYQISTWSEGPRHLPIGGQAFCLKMILLLRPKLINENNQMSIRKSLEDNPLSS